MDTSIVNPLFSRNWASHALSRPQSVFALQKELSREGERRYTKLSVGEKVRLQFDTIVTDTKKTAKSVSAFGNKAK